MGSVQVRSLDGPDETRRFPNGMVEMYESYCVAGSAVVQAADGTETRIGPGDGYVIEPGHDAWVVGDEPRVTVDFSQAMADYARPS